MIPPAAMPSLTPPRRESMALPASMTRSMAPLPVNMPPSMARLIMAISAASIRNRMMRKSPRKSLKITILMRISPPFAPVVLCLA